MNDNIVQIKDIKDFGMQIARIHNQPLLHEEQKNTLLNGNYLYLRACTIGMPYYKEVEDAFIKMDVIVNQITNSEIHPFVTLWDKDKKSIKSLRNTYGNPAWDLGIIINQLQHDSKIESFLKGYFLNGGILITIIELYIGIIFAMLNDAITKHDKVAWQQLAKNECVDIIYNNEIQLSVLSPEVISRLSLPGLKRIG